MLHCTGEVRTGTMEIHSKQFPGGCSFVNGRLISLEVPEVTLGRGGELTAAAGGASTGLGGGAAADTLPAIPRNSTNTIAVIFRRDIVSSRRL